MLHVHRAERSDRLIAGLADVLAEPLEDPLATEVVSVYSRGIERWIAQELSQRLGAGPLGTDGVCSNVAFPFPGGLIREAIARGSGIVPERDPWLPTRLTWPLLRLAVERSDALDLGPLRTHLGGDDPDRLARRLGAVRHLADLFDRYSVERPDMVLRWCQGDPVGPDGDPLPDRHRWQAFLWRLVHDELDVPSFAERYDAAAARLADDPTLLDEQLPPRLSLFGLTALPKTFLATLETIAEHRDVHIFLQHPSPALWERVSRSIVPGAVGARTLPRREDDDTADLVQHPLLRAWGRDVRELQMVVPSAGTDRHHGGPADEPGSLLERVQADVRADRALGAVALAGAARPVLNEDDRSIQVHDCHGRLRQVEVLRDAILHLLAEDPTLEPRDVIVMCPDIERFAPLVTAVFGAEAVAHDGSPLRGGEDEPPSLRVRLADRSLRRTNPVLEVVTLVLEMVDGRVTASSVLDLLSREPVRRRFRLHDDDVDLIESWVSELQIRWGLDAASRVRQGLPPLDAHTWRAGLERLLLGTAMADEYLRFVPRRGDAPSDLADVVVPFDDVEGGMSDVAGRLAELVQRLAAALASMDGARTIDAWRDVIGDAAEALTATDSDTSWQRAQLHRVLGDVVDEATLGEDASTVALTLAEVRAMLDERLAGRPSRTSHRTGDLTVSTLVPMRSVPHRVVCLLGLDDGAFPRQVVPDSDDVLLESPRVGDRDARSEDRQLLLDALLSATDTLLVTYAGRNPRTNEPRPPAVPVDELLDVVDRTVASGDPARRPRDLITIPHPLAEHDERNVTPGALRPDGRPWSFHRSTLDAAVARRAERRPVPDFLSGELSPIDADVIELDDLVAFLEHPAKAFVRQRLELSLPTDGDRRNDAIPAALGGLDEWKLGQALLEEWLRAGDLPRALQVMRGRGLVPPGQLANDDLDRVRTRFKAITRLATDVGVVPGPRASEEVEVRLPDGRILQGTVPNLGSAGVELLTYSKVKPKHRLATYARWLALRAFEPDRGWRTAVVGRATWGGEAEARCIDRVPSDDEQASVTSQLVRLVDLYDRGMRSPIPLYCETSAKIADNIGQGNEPSRYANFAWESNLYKGFVNEDADPYHQLVLGGVRTVDELFTEVCRGVDETAWHDSNLRAVAYAWRLWEPVLEHEKRRRR